MHDQTAIQQVLHENLVQSRLRNPSYSLRAYARKLGLSSAAVSEILNGKRRVSHKLAARIAERMCLSPGDTRRLLEPFSIKRPKTAGNQQMVLDMDQFHLISDWHHFAILSLAETQDFRPDPTWIAGRLGIGIPAVELAFERFERLGMATRDAHGTLIFTKTQYATSDHIANTALRKSHAQNLELAHRSLEQDPVDVRDFTAVTMAIDPAKLPNAKAMIREFRNQLCSYLESEGKTQVYKLCFQLFPLSKV